jgi:hypothetical protein
METGDGPLACLCTVTCGIDVICGPEAIGFEGCAPGCRPGGAVFILGTSAAALVTAADCPEGWETGAAGVDPDPGVAPTGAGGPEGGFGLAIDAIGTSVSVPGFAALVPAAGRPGLRYIRNAAEALKAIATSRNTSFLDTLTRPLLWSGSYRRS